jgi:hypothetical protein
MNRALIPLPAEARAAFRRQLEADLPIVTPVWVATDGGAAMCNTPMKKEIDDEA